MRDGSQGVFVRCVFGAVYGPGREAALFRFICEGEVCSQLQVCVEEHGSRLEHRVEDEHLEALSEGGVVVEDAVETQQLVFLRLVHVYERSFGQAFEAEAGVRFGLLLAEQLEGVCDHLVVQPGEGSCGFEDDAVSCADVVDEDVFDVDLAFPRDASDASVVCFELRQGVAVFVQDRHDRLELVCDFLVGVLGVSVSCLVADEGEQRHSLRRGLADDAAGFVAGPGEELLGREQAPAGRVSAGFELCEEVDAAVCLRLAAHVSQGVSELLLQVGFFSAGDYGHEVGQVVSDSLVVLLELCVEAVCELEGLGQVAVVREGVPVEVHGVEHGGLEWVANVQFFLHLFDDSEEFVDLRCDRLGVFRVLAQLEQQFVRGLD